MARLSKTVSEDARPQFNFIIFHIRFVVHRTPCSTDLAPADLHLCGPLKDALCGHRFADDDDDLKHNVHEDFRRFSKEFYLARGHPVVFKIH